MKIPTIAKSSHGMYTQYGWPNVKHLIYHDVGVFMYKTMNGLSPAISSFQNVKEI